MKDEKQFKKCMKCKYVDLESDFPNMWCDLTIKLLDDENMVCPLKQKRKIDEIIKIEESEVF